MNYIKIIVFFVVALTMMQVGKMVFGLDPPNVDFSWEYIKYTIVIVLCTLLVGHGIIKIADAIRQRRKREE